MSEQEHTHEAKSPNNPPSAKTEEQHKFYLLPQSHASNRLQKEMTVNRFCEAVIERLNLTGNLVIEGTDFELSVSGYNELESGIRQSAAMLLDSLLIAAADTGFHDTLVTLPVKEYMSMRGLKSEKEVRKQVIQDIDALKRISFKHKGIGKQKKSWLQFSLYGGTSGQISNGDIVFRFNQDFFNSFKVSEQNKYLYMYFPRAALQGNIRRFPHKYWLARKIAEHKRMNLGKRNESIISVRSLIDACPTLPTYEEVMSSGRAVTKRIIEPFERDMDALGDNFSWEYAGIEEPTDYKTFISATIIIHWSNYPDTAELVQKKKQRAKRQAAYKNKRTGGSG